MNTVGSGDFLTDLIQFLFDFAFSQGFGVAQICKDEEYRSLADKTKDLIIINTNWKNKSELPFIIGHEIGHLMDGDVGLSYYCGNALTSKEHHADLYSLKTTPHDNTIVLMSQANLCKHMVYRYACMMMWLNYLENTMIYCFKNKKSLQDSG